MAVANTLAYYDTTVEGFIAQGPRKLGTSECSQAPMSLDLGPVL